MQPSSLLHVSDSYGATAVQHLLQQPAPRRSSPCPPCLSPPTQSSDHAERWRLAWELNSTPQSAMRDLYLSIQARDGIPPARIAALQSASHIPDIRDTRKESCRTSPLMPSDRRRSSAPASEIPPSPRLRTR